MTNTDHKGATDSGCPVRRLGARDRPAICRHLLALDAADRSLRFGVAPDAAAIARYVETIDFDHGAALGAVAADGTLVGLAHLALEGGVAELGLSVLPGHRRGGVGGALAAAAVREAERLRADELRLYCAADNRGMRRIADGLGMEVASEGTDLTARRRLGDAAQAAPAIAGA